MPPSYENTDDAQASLDAKARLADYLANRPWWQSPEGVRMKWRLTWTAIAVMVVIGLLILAAQGLDALDLRLNYVRVPGKVLVVSTTCVLEDSGRHFTMRMDMPCARAFARQDHPGFLQVLRVRATSDLTYGYVVGGRPYSARAVERLDVPFAGTAINVYVRKDDATLSRYGGLVN